MKFNEIIISLLYKVLTGFAPFASFAVYRESTHPTYLTKKYSMEQIYAELNKYSAFWGSEESLSG